MKCYKGYDKSDHDCRVNHTGSSKSMEPSIAVEIISKNPLLIQEGVQIFTLIGDDDSLTIAAVRRESCHDVYKWSHKNHATGHLSIEY